MRTLSRRPASTSDARRILVPTASVTDERRRAKVTGRRRRRVLFARLLWLAGLTLVPAVLLGGAWIALHLLVDAGVVAAVVWLRRCAVREAAEARAERLARIAARDEAEREAYLRSRARERALAAARSAPPVRRAVGD